MSVHVTVFTDPACPFAFSAEPARWRLRWLYGDQLEWQPRMIVLTREEGHAEALAQGAPTLQREHGMPIDPEPRDRPASSDPAARAVVAARLYRPEAEEPLLRALRVRTHAGGLMDDPELIDSAATDAGLDPRELESWTNTPETAVELERDVADARKPSAAAAALDHKLGGPREERRYTAPSYELRTAEDDHTAAVPGFNPIEAYEVAIANLDPSLARRADPESVGDVLTWAPVPLATAEVAAVMGCSLEEARTALAADAVFAPAGADGYWTSA